MKLLNAFLFSTVLLLSASSYAGYNCQALLNDNGELGPVLVTIDELVKDEEILSTLRSPLYLDDSTFIKYQYWVDAGNDYHMVHFIGIKNELGTSGEPVLSTKNLFCKDNGFIDEAW